MGRGRQRGSAPRSTGCGADRVREGEEPVDLAPAHPVRRVLRVELARRAAAVGGEGEGERERVADAEDRVAVVGVGRLEAHELGRRHLGGKTSMQWVIIITYCFEDEAASGQAEAAVANREPVSQRRRRRGALPNANATSATRAATRPLGTVTIVSHLYRFCRQSFELDSRDSSKTFYLLLRERGEIKKKS